MSKIIELEYTGETLADATAGDIVEFINDGRLFVVQGFVDDRAVIAHIDRYKLCFSKGLQELDRILESLRSDYDIVPGAYDNFKVVYPRAIGG
jgi:hypothetical protein